MKKKAIQIDLDQLRKLSALQCSEKEVAAVIGCGVMKFRKILATMPEVKDAWDFGRESGKISLRRKQFSLASTSSAMAIYLGKQILGQRDVTGVELTGRDGGPIETAETIDVAKLTQNERDQLRSILSRASQSQATT